MGPSGHWPHATLQLKSRRCLGAGGSPNQRPAAAGLPEM
jgi:hypothetical protein